MNLTKCSKGHFYDSDKFASCPHCNPGGARGDSATVALSSVGPSDATMAIPSGGSEGVTVSMPSDGGADPVTRASYASQDPVTQKSYQKTDDVLIPPVDNGYLGDSSLPDDEGVTVSYYGRQMAETKEMTAEPVVGWLVCVSGRYFGQSFPLKSGRNFVGRSSHMDVCLDRENTVSRDRHAVIIYEPKSRMFLAQPGDSRELFYVNDKVILDNKVLKPYDNISIGKVELKLVPFCTKDFAWEDLEKKDSGKKEEKKETE